MLIFTSFFYYKDGVILQLINGSVQSTTEYFATNRIVTLLLFIICLISLISYLKNKQKSILIFISIFIIWFLSGRTIGVHHTGELSLGWFYVETDKIVLWERGNCEGNILENTDFQRRFLYNLFYENNCISGEIYAGPFIIMDLERSLNK